MTEPTINQAPYLGNRLPAKFTGRAATIRRLLLGEVERLQSLADEICGELYGQGFEVSGWHLNGDLEPLDSWFDNNGWCEAAQAAKGQDDE